MPTIHKILATTALCLAAVVQDRMKEIKEQKEQD